MVRLIVSIVILSGIVPSFSSAATQDCADDPVRSGISRTIAADSVNAPIYGHFLKHQVNKPRNRSLPLRDKEVVLTFDDGPLPAQTLEMLGILDKHCVKATFFAVGKMALANPKVMQEVAKRGHTIGTHTWSHPGVMDELSPEEIKYEIEKGFIAVSQAMGKPIAPFFRFPGLRDSQAGANYLSTRNISVWSVDVVSGDTDPGATSAKIRRDTLVRVRQQGRGIILFHDIKRITVDAMDGILSDLKSEGYKVVHVVSNTYYQPDANLVAKGEPMAAAPEATTITGRMLASAREKLKDGSVDVMHTEWVDLKAASDQLSVKSGGPVQVSTGGGTQASNPSYPSPSLLVSGRVR